jgi:Brp/Blh family beta-carotene 15,15'-monooxygenase
MTKYSNYSIVASFFGLWLDSIFSHHIQIFLGFSLIFSFGILLGANDLLIIEFKNSRKTTNSFIKTLLLYIVIVTISAILFYLIPWFALFLFIIVSAFHFGEQQWKELISFYPNWICNSMAFTYGLFILLLLFIFHTSEVENIIFEITKIRIPTLFIPLLFKIFGIAFLLTSAYSFYKYTEIRVKILTEVFYLIVFTIIFKTSSLIWGFSIYFIFWHSIPSILEQMKFLYGNYSLPNFKNYCKSAFIYWFISILGIIILYYIFREDQIFNAIFFSFLAAITFPHAFVITKMYNKKPNGITPKE